MVLYIPSLFYNIISLFIVGSHSLLILILQHIIYYQNNLLIYNMKNFPLLNLIINVSLTADKLLFWLYNAHKNIAISSCTHNLYYLIIHHSIYNIFSHSIQHNNRLYNCLILLSYHELGFTLLL